MRTALVLGGTGLVGSNLIELLISSGYYFQVYSLVRRLSGKSKGGLTEVIIDFESPDIKLIKADDLYCCLGTTIKNAGSKANFYKVDHDYVLKIASIALANGTNRIALVSSMGANKNATVFYNRVKGEIEDDIIKLNFNSCFILRPSILLGQRKERRPAESIAKFVMTLLQFVIPKKYKPVEASKVPSTMIQMMKSEKSGTCTIENDEILNQGNSIL